MGPLPFTVTISKKEFPSLENIVLLASGSVTGIDINEDKSITIETDSNFHLSEFALANKNEFSEEDYLLLDRLIETMENLESKKISYLTLSF